jgi:type II secretory pathway pseudopilin PulG
MKGRGSRGGWSLVELLIVMIIVVLLMTAMVALFNEMFRGQGVREGGRVFMTALSDARQLAATKRVDHILRLYNQTDGGVIEIYEDTNGNKVYDSGDKLIEGGKTYLPQHCFFMDSPKLYPDWILLANTGTCKYAPGFSGVERNEFDANANLSKPQLVADVALWIKGRPYKLLMDIDKVTGKVRRQEFLFDE